MSEPPVHFFRREEDGSVRLRIRFTPEEAALIEEAAGTVPVMLFIHRMLYRSARHYVNRALQQQEELDDDDDFEYLDDDSDISPVE